MNVQKQNALVQDVMYGGDKITYPAKLEVALNAIHAARLQYDGFGRAPSERRKLDQAEVKIRAAHTKASSERSKWQDSVREFDDRFEKSTRKISDFNALLDVAMDAIRGNDELKDIYDDLSAIHSKYRNKKHKNTMNALDGLRELSESNARYERMMAASKMPKEKAITQSGLDKSVR